MKLLEFAQLANSTLGAAESGKNLLTAPQSNGSVSGLPQQMNAVGTALTSEIRGVGAAVQQGFGTLNSMGSQMLTQQATLRQETQQVLADVAGLNALMKKHMTEVEDQFRFIVEESVLNARYQLDAHVNAKEGVVASDEEIRTWLRVLQTWISKNFSDLNKTITMSSVDPIQFLLQFPDNIWFIVSRMRSLFGNLIPDKFHLLPPVSIKFYFSIITAYLNGLKKNPHLMGPDKAASICQEILNTLNLYLEFSKFLKDNPQIIQALFDRYENHVNKNTHQSANAQEIRSLLKIIVPLIENKQFTEQLTSLEKTQRVPLTKSADIWDQLPNTLSPKERMKKMVALLSQEDAPKAAQTKFMILPEGAAYTPIPTQINWASYGAPDGSSTSYWGCSYFPNQPKPPAFVSVSVLFLLLASGYADTNFFRNATLKKQAGNLIASCPSNTYAVHTGGSYRAARFDDVGVVRIEATYDNGHQHTENTFIRYNGREYFIKRNLLTWGSDAKTEFPYVSNSSIYSGHRANIFEYHAKLTDVLPAEYEALLNNTKPNDLEKYKILFKYYVLYSLGQIAEADAYIRKQSFTQEYEKAYMLFLVAIAGRWDIFEAFDKIHPITNYSLELVGSSLTTPSNFARQYGHRDVTAGLAAKLFPNTALQSTGTADTSDYENALKEIQNSVTTIKIKLSKYVPQPPMQHAAVAAAQPANPLPEPVTDDEQEDSLNKSISGFFAKRKMHAGTYAFVTKPTTRPYNRTGHRTIRNTFFAGDNELRGDLHRYLEKEKSFTVSREGKLDDQLLFILPVGRP